MSSITTIATTDNATPATTELEVLFKAVKLACVKALGIMMSNGISKSCLCAALVASQILKHFDVKYTVKAGYSHVEGSEESLPHVWVETPSPIVGQPPLITDLTFSGPYRKVIILNWNVGFHDDAMKAVYTDTPAFPPTPLSAKALPVAVLKQQCEHLDQYLLAAPAFVKEFVVDALRKAFDDSDKLTISGMAADVLTAGLPVEPM